MKISVKPLLASLRTTLIGKAATVSTPIDVAELKRLREELLVENDWISKSTCLPTDADFALMGKFIQLYCYAEFNARRLADALSTKITGLRAINYYRLNDTDLLIHLRKLASRDIWNPDMKSKILMAVDILEMHRTHRHSFAHWW